MHSREGKIGIWNVVWIDDEVVVFVEAAVHGCHVKLHLESTVHDGEVDCVYGASEKLKRNEV